MKKSYKYGKYGSFEHLLLLIINFYDSMNKINYNIILFQILTMHDFMKPNGEKKLLFYYQEPEVSEANGNEIFASYKLYFDVS